MQIKMLTGVLKGSIIDVLIQDENQLRSIDSTTEFVIEHSENEKFPNGTRFFMTDDLAESILFERYKKIRSYSLIGKSR